MKAGVMTGVSVIKCVDVPEPQCGPDQIKVKVAYCGICGSDIEVLEGRFNPGGRPQAAQGPPKPRIMGHEVSGTIIEIGKDCKHGYRVGQRVACNFLSFCGACYYCRNKMEHFCTSPSGGTGGFAEYALYKENMVYALPEDVPLDIGALLEPVSVAVHTIDLANVHPGTTVAISGAGPIGLLSLELAVKAGAARVMVSEPVAEKRQLALKLGADVVVDPFNENLEEAGKKLTDGRGFDSVIEASGSVKAAKQAVFLADRAGTIIWAAVYPGDVEIGVPPFYMYQNELRIQSVKISPYSFPRSLNLLPKLNLKPIITHIVPLAEVDNGFKIHHERKAVKILIQP
jgi:(R,R)-butanediol dehydrogenase/meso-butanediol dehydrogenase/diacetyl reductase